MRPTVSVVMPFSGDLAAARTAIATLVGLAITEGDQLILVDNGVTDGLMPPPEVEVVAARAERSPAYARNVGAEHARADWILFLDADCHAPNELLDAYFVEPIDERTGALAGEVSPAPAQGETLAARYGASRRFLNQRQHLAHSYRPRAVAANLLVRRQAFQQIGGFYEGLRAAEDTDFSWRLQQAGWRLELRPAAGVQHRYRSSIGELRRQWRGYAAGRAWLARRYDGFVPQPAAARAARRLRGRIPGQRLRLRGASPRRAAPRSARSSEAGVLERGRYFMLDALLAGEELAGFALSNRPELRDGRRPSARVVLIAERFPSPGDPLIDFARTLAGARVEAIARPEALAVDAARALEIDYQEDDGLLARALGLLYVLVRHPLRALLDVRRRPPYDPPLSALAPAVRRLQRDRGARLHALGGPGAADTALRLAALAGKPMD